MPAVILIVGLFWLLESPRWLIQKGKYEKARAVIKKLHSDIDQGSDFVNREFDQIRRQIDYEREVTIKSFWALFFKASSRKRLMLGILLQVFLQTTGINVVNCEGDISNLVPPFAHLLDIQMNFHLDYQTTLFKGVGVQGRNVLWLSCGYGMMGPIANVICLTYIDRVGRRLPLAWSSVGLAVNVELLTVFSKEFAVSDNNDNNNDNNVVGQGFMIAWTFTFSFIFSLGYNAIQLVYIAEIFPMALRSRITASMSVLFFLSSILRRIG